MLRSLVACFVIFISLTCVALASREYELSDVVVGAETKKQEHVSIDEYNGKSTIKEEQIQNLPSSNHDIASVLKVLPNVQLNAGSRNSNNIAEIAPQDISINGAPFYQNNFMLDGVNINNNLNSDAVKKFNDNHTIPFGLMDTHSQGVHIDTDSIESINVYDSLIPAKYGGFNGGVIDVKTRTPSRKLNGKMSISHTQDSWTKFHTDSANQRRLARGGAVIPHQDRFHKNIFNSHLEGFLRDDFGFSLSYSMTHSKFTQLDVDHDLVVKHDDNGKKIELGRDLTRRMDNFLVKGVWYPSDTLVLTPTISYSPSLEDNYLAHSKNSYSKQIEENYILGLKAEIFLDEFTIEQNFGFSSLNTKRNSDTNYFIGWWHDPGFKDWGTGASKSPLNKTYEGGYGDIEQKEKSFFYSIDLLSEEVDLGKSSHKFNLGFDYSHRIGFFNAPEVSYFTGLTRIENTRVFDGLKAKIQAKIDDINNNQIAPLEAQWLVETDPDVKDRLRAKIDQLQEIVDTLDGEIFVLDFKKDEIGFDGTQPGYTQCAPNDPLCYADGTGVRQFADEANMYGAGSVEVKVSQLGFYLDDEINNHHLTIRPGIRYDWDNYMRRHTFAPRLASYYDLFGDKKLIFSAGINRYYGRSSFAYKLNDEIASKLDKRVKRVLPTDPWQIQPNAYVNTYADLRIPYNDELALGVSYEFFNFGLNVKFVNRVGKDQITTQKIGKGADAKKRLTNNGKSKSDIYTVTFKSLNDYIFMDTENGFELAFDYSTSKRNFESSRYDDGYLEGNRTKDSYIKYNGKVIKVSEKNAENFNTPFTLRLMTHTRFPDANFLFSNFFNFRGAYRMDVYTEEDFTFQGIQIPVIETRRFNSSLTWDSRFSYQRRVGKFIAFSSIDILNVLNKKSVVGFNEGGHGNIAKPTSYDPSIGETLYAPGRQFWLEAGMKF